MGCGFTNRSELELRLNEFVNFLIVTQIKDSQYTEQIRSAYNNDENSRLTEKLVYFLNPRTRINNPYQTDIINLQNDVRSRSQSEQVFIAFSLLFLSRSNAESLKTNFVLLKETFKSELNSFNFDFEQLKSLLKFYFAFISAGVLRAYKTRSPTISAKDSVQVQELENYYAEPVIDAYIKLFTEILSGNFTLEKFFAEKIDYLHHENVRDELKNFYLESPLFGKRQQYTPVRVEVPRVEAPTLVSASRPTTSAYEVSSVNYQAPSKVIYESAPALTSSGRYYTTYQNYSTPANSLQNSLTNQGNQGLNLVSSGAPTFVRNQSFSSKNISLASPATDNLVLYKNPSNLKGIPLDTVDSMRDGALRYHNEIRSVHSANFLFKNEELEALAQSWAETLASNETIRNSAMVWNGLSIGENVAFADFDGCDAKLVLKSWYDQRQNYNYSLNQLQRNCGAFTQMAWRKSHQFGLGVAQSKSGKIYFVANYFPAGNVKEEFVENVKPASYNSNL